MVVYHANRLHKGVDNRWSDKLKTFFEKSVAELFSKWRKGWNFCHSSVFINDGFVVNKAPTKSVKASILFLDSKNCVGICDSGTNLQLIKNRGSAKSCLHCFQGQSFEECLIIVARNSPFVVMVIHHLL